MKGPLRFTAFAVLALLALAALPATARPEDAARADPEAVRALFERWAEAEGDEARRAVEEQARALPPLHPDDVEPLAKLAVELARKHGPRLVKSGRGWFYDGDDKRKRRGLYMVAPSRKGRGLLLALHGGGEGSGDAGSAFSIWSGATAQGMTVIAPEVQTKVSSAWNQEPEERFVLELLDAARRTFDVDPDRIYVAGHSMGGDGSWMIGGRNADRFAAIAPLAGSVMPYLRPGAVNKRHTPVSDYVGLQEGVIANLMYLPVHCFHSADDENEAIHPDDLAARLLGKLAERFPGRYELTYDRIDGNGHALPPRGVKPILEWMAEKRRVRDPQEVVWETWWPWTRQMHWLHHPAPKDAWRFHARVTGPNEVDVEATTKPVAGRTEPGEVELTLLLSRRMFDLDRPLRVTSGGKTIHEAAVQRSAWAVLVTAGRRLEPELWYEAAVTVTVPRGTWRELWDAR